MQIDRQFNYDFNDTLHSIFGQLFIKLL